MVPPGRIVTDSDAGQTVDTVVASLASVVDPEVAAVVVESVPSVVVPVSPGSVTVESNTEMPLSTDTS